MASIERSPPLGDFSGRDAYDPGERPPVIIHTTTGTTGRPQVIPFGPRGREVQNLMLARAYRLHGITDDDVVHSVYGHGLINGGHYIREALTHWTGATFLSAGTGIETRSVQQIELMRTFRASVIVGFVDYVKRLAAVAREMGLEPRRDLKVRMISGHIGTEDRASLSGAWGGCDLYDWYGVADTGLIAAEGPDHDGLYVMEDAHVLEIADVDHGRPVTDGAAGDMIVTALFKDDIYPMIRFNTHDVTRWRLGSSSLGLGFRRIDGFLGRSDNMVKLRGINVFPHAIGALLSTEAAFSGEYLCRLERDAVNRDTLTVSVEVMTNPADDGLEGRLRTLLRGRLGVEIGIELVTPGSLAELTQVEKRQKAIRLIDARGFSGQRG
jgi:phenylacetate-CoA ligase